MAKFSAEEKLEAVNRALNGKESYRSSKTYGVTIKSLKHEEQAAFQENDEFKQLAKKRYKIEAKNSEFKKSAWLQKGQIDGFIWHGNKVPHNNIRRQP